MGDEVCLVNNILLNIFLCVKQKKEMYTRLEQSEGELRVSFFFW